MGPMKETDQEDMSGGMTCGEEGPPIGIVAGTEVIQQKQNPGWEKRPAQWTDTKNEEFSSGK